MTSAPHSYQYRLTPRIPWQAKILEQVRKRKKAQRVRRAGYAVMWPILLQKSVAGIVEQ